MNQDLSLNLQLSEMIKELGFDTSGVSEDLQNGGYSLSINFRLPRAEARKIEEAYGHMPEFELLLECEDDHSWDGTIRLSIRANRQSQSQTFATIEVADGSDGWRFKLKTCLVALGLGAQMMTLCAA